MTLARLVCALSIGGACSGSATDSAFELGEYWVAEAVNGLAAGRIAPSSPASGLRVVLGRGILRFGEATDDVQDIGVLYRCEAPWGPTTTAEPEIEDGNFYGVMRYSVGGADWADAPVVTIEHYEESGILETICVFDVVDELVCARRDSLDEDLPPESLDFAVRYFRVGDTLPVMTCARVMELTMLSGSFSR